MIREPARTPTPDDDEALETAIDAACRTLAAAGNRQQRRQAWWRLRRLVNQRRAQQVARLERERGLR